MSEQNKTKSKTKTELKLKHLSKGEWGVFNGDEIVFISTYILCQNYIRDNK